MHDCLKKDPEIMDYLRERYRFRYVSYKIIEENVRYSTPCYVVMTDLFKIIFKMGKTTETASLGGDILEDLPHYNILVEGQLLHGCTPGYGYSFIDRARQSVDMLIEKMLSRSIDNWKLCLTERDNDHIQWQDEIRLKYEEIQRINVQWKSSLEKRAIKERK